MSVFALHVLEHNLTELGMVILEPPFLQNVEQLCLQVEDANTIYSSH